MSHTEVYIRISNAIYGGIYIYYTKSTHMTMHYKYIYIDNTIKQDFIICTYIYICIQLIILRKIEVNRVIMMCVYIDIPLYKHPADLRDHPLQTFDLAPES